MPIYAQLIGIDGKHMCFAEELAMIFDSHGDSTPKKSNHYQKNPGVTHKLLWGNYIIKPHINHGDK